MKRYVPFASLGVLLALLINAAVPAPSRPDAAPKSPAPIVDVEQDGEAFDADSRSETWRARHSLVPRARLERAPSKIDGAQIHAERSTSKRRR